MDLSEQVSSYQTETDHSVNVIQEWSFQIPQVQEAVALAENTELSWQMQ